MVTMIGMCVCGHGRNLHQANKGVCLVQGDNGQWCPCWRYTENRHDTLAAVADLGTVDPDPDGLRETRKTVARRRKVSKMDDLNVTALRNQIAWDLIDEVGRSALASGLSREEVTEHVEAWMEGVDWSTKGLASAPAQPAPTSDGRVRVVLGDGAELFVPMDAIPEMMRLYNDRARLMAKNVNPELTEAREQLAQVDRIIAENNYTGKTVPTVEAAFRDLATEKANAKAVRDDLTQVRLALMELPTNHSGMSTVQMAQNMMKRAQESAGNRQRINAYEHSVKRIESELDRLRPFRLGQEWMTGDSDG